MSTAKKKRRSPMKVGDLIKVKATVKQSNFVEGITKAKVLSRHTDDWGTSYMRIKLLKRSSYFKVGDILKVFPSQCEHCIEDVEEIYLIY